MAYNRARRFSPLPPDGEWTRHHSWSEVYALCDDARALRGGLKRLRTCAPPSSIRQLVEAQPRFPVHPVVHDYVFRGNRFSLGQFAVAVERYKPKRLKERLWNREGYSGFIPELVAGLTIAHTGATMIHEPLGAKGPDWSATWGSGSGLYAEVVCPRLSKQSRRFEWITMHLQWKLMDAFAQSASIRSDVGTRITFVFPDGLIEDLAARGAVSDEAVPSPHLLDDLVREAITVLDALAWPVPDGVYPMGRVGEIVVRRDASAGPGFGFGGDVVPWSEMSEAERLRGVLSDKAGQLRRVPELPGLIVVDTSGDSLSRNLTSHVLYDLETESWAADLAGVIVLDRVWNGTPDCVAVFLPGKRWEAALDLVEGLPECEHGHLHAPSGVFRVPPCPGNPWL